MNKWSKLSTCYVCLSICIDRFTKSVHSMNSSDVHMIQTMMNDHAIRFEERKNENVGSICRHIEYIISKSIIFVILSMR